jgi:hypothetical protein
MSTFESDLGTLKSIHVDLLAAVQATDVERIAPLIARRGDLLARLAESFAAASPIQRDSWQPLIKNLAADDRELNTCFTNVRDRLASELASASAHGATPPSGPSASNLNIRA